MRLHSLVKLLLARCVQAEQDVNSFLQLAVRAWESLYKDCGFMPLQPHVPFRNMCLTLFFRLCVGVFSRAFCMFQSYVLFGFLLPFVFI